MNTDHEAVMEGLKNWLADRAPGFKKYTRKELFLTDVNAQPCCFVRKIGAEFEFPNGINQRTTIDAEIWLACPSAKSADVASDTQLNKLVASILNAFAPDSPYGRFTLGGLAFWCRIEGHSDQYPGDIGSQSLCCLPVKITLP